MRKTWFGSAIIVISLSSLAAMLAGCGKNDTAKESGKEAAGMTETPAASQPVTIKMANHSANMSVEQFQRYVARPVKEKYPYITVEHVDISVKGNTLAELVASNDLPDLYVHQPLNLLPFADFGISYNIEELIKQNKFDLNRLPAEYLETMRLSISKDYLIGLPINNNAFGLFYNKNLFDRFGTPYPTDGMTWEQVLNLAAKVNRFDGGVQYVGLNPGNVTYGARQLNLPWFDVKTDKPVFQTQGWKDLFQLWLSLTKLPGGEMLPKGTNIPNTFNDGKIAMFAGYSILIDNMLKTKDLQWDVVTYPTNPKAPGIGSSVDPLAVAVTSASKHKTEAFRVLSVILSDEVQLDMSKNAMMSVLKDRKIQDEFGKGKPELASKNMVAMTKLKLAPLQPYKYPLSPNPASLMNSVFTEMVYSNKDMNTTLREADEQLSKAIRTVLEK
ncbi:MAG: extracellular solute-binding protein family 1 [Paenibacillus sp.]|nr:extracellular solute-binding protein family 1 [Paenibacillus sp.]